MNQKSELVEETELLSLPICETNRNIVTDQTFYASHVFFNVGSMKLIDRAP